MPKSRFFLLAAPALLAGPAAAQEVYGGVYKHQVNALLSKDIGEGGVDLQLGYRTAPVKALSFIGSPSPYLFGSLNLQGDTSFAAAGLSWRLGKGPVFLRPGAGIAVHDGPVLHDRPKCGKRTDLGCRVQFQLEIALGTRLSDSFDIEASWIHMSHAHLFSEQNPGLDVVGVRLTYRLR